MHTLKHRTLALIMSLIMILSCFAGMSFSVGAITSSDYVYDELDDGTISITKYYGDGSDVNIPSKIDGKEVAKIDHGAFYGCTGLKNIKISKSLREICSEAFMECTGLENIVIIPEGVKKIGFRAFAGCTGLKSINISECVTEIRDFAF